MLTYSRSNTSRGPILLGLAAGMALAAAAVLVARRLTDAAVRRRQVRIAVPRPAPYPVETGT